MIIRSGSILPNANLQNISLTTPVDSVGAVFVGAAPGNLYFHQDPDDPYTSPAYLPPPYTRTLHPVPETH